MDQEIYRATGLIEGWITGKYWEIEEAFTLLCERGEMWRYHGRLYENWNNKEPGTNWVEPTGI